jgi:predicted TPR repeat methyltransferase
VLDLGCGTGLCGPQLRAMANQLTGVDLSAPMLEVAAQRRVHDQLLQADLADHLADTMDRVDLVVAADVFIYIGDLTPVFNGVRRVLKPGGVFAFSVERGSDDAAFVLQPSLRFAHGERSVRELAAQHGLQVLKVEQAALRVDETHAVQGQYWLLTG